MSGQTAHYNGVIHNYIYNQQYTLCTLLYLQPTIYIVLKKLEVCRPTVFNLIDI
jgi:hypothetical protein